MSAWVTAFETAWNTDSMWAEASLAAPLIGLVVVFAFGYHILRHLVGGIARGSARM